MRVVVVATKLPWPPIDGGRLALWRMLEALAAAGVRPWLLAPAATPLTGETLDALQAVCEPQAVVVRPRTWFASSGAALRARCSLTMARHRHAALEATLARAVAERRPDVVHAEQLQAFGNCGPAIAAGVPVVLRAHNVESRLWQASAGHRLLARPLAFEAARVQRDEARAIRMAQRVLAISPDDAAALRALAPDAAGRVHVFAPPFPAWLPAGAPQPGAPAVALGGSGGWWPNREAAHWFVAQVVPRLRQRCPQARVHVLGPLRRAVSGVEVHAAPADAIDAFPAGALAAVPLHVGSGLRMRILEAWARGLPVVASPAAAAGLGACDGGQLLIAEDAEGFAAALARLAQQPALAQRLVAAGRAHLERHHAPSVQCAALLAHYEQAAQLRERS